MWGAGSRGVADTYGEWRTLTAHGRLPNHIVSVLCLVLLVGGRSTSPPLVTFVQEGYFVAFHGFLAVDENGLPSKTTFLPTILSWNMGNAFSGRGNLLLEVV